jgi:hypothetical protein
MPIKFVTTERCHECRAKNPTDRSPPRRYQAPTTCEKCHHWNDEFHTTLERVELRIGFRWNGGYENPNAFD